MLSCVQLFVIPWTVAHQAPPSMGSPRQEYWSGLLFPSPGDLPDPGIEPRLSPALQGDSLLTWGKPHKTDLSRNKSATITDLVNRSLLRFSEDGHHPTAEYIIDFLQTKSWGFHCALLPTFLNNFQKGLCWGIIIILKHSSKKSRSGGAIFLYLLRSFNIGSRIRA